MRILIYFLFFLFVQIVASQYAFAKPSKFYANTAYKKHNRSTKSELGKHTRHVAITGNRSKRKAEHQRLVASLREAKKGKKKQAGNLLPSFDDQGASVSGGRVEKIIISEQSSSGDYTPTYTPAENLEDEAFGW